MTPNFSLKELTRTDQPLDNLPETEEMQSRLIQLAMNLEHVRALLGHRPVYISSGYRTPKVNSKVGGSSTSDHMTGYCADIVPPVGLLDAMRIIESSWLPFDQLILERAQGIVHISFAPPFRRQILTRKGNRYFSGILSA
jgi:zinc D-Ala-D-Ala carboxypeptidase